MNSDCYGGVVRRNSVFQFMCNDLRKEIVNALSESLETLFQMSILGRVPLLQNLSFALRNFKSADTLLQLVNRIICGPLLQSIHNRMRHIL